MLDFTVYTAGGGFKREPSDAQLSESCGMVSLCLPHRAIISAIQAGVPVVSLSIPFSLADRSYQESLEVAKEYNIKVGRTVTNRPKPFA
jgi:hypothetical protein